MRVLFSVTYYTPYISGLTICVKRLAESLAERSCGVSVLCMRHDGKLETEKTINGVRVVRANPLVKISKGFLSIDWILKTWREVRKSDIVVINLPQAEGFVPAVIARLHKKKVIVVYYCEVDISNKIIQKMLEITHLIALHAANKIVTLTKDYANHSRLLKKFDGVVEVYPPISIAGMSGKKNFKKTKGIKWIGVVSRLAKEKGIEYLLEALPLLKNCKIIIAGPVEPVGEDEYKNKIMNLVSKFHNQVEFMGTLDEQDMGNFYRAIDVLVLPSVNSTEAFGMVQVEAMLHGTPVVASDLPGVRVPILKTEMGKLARPGDSKSLATAIEWVIENRTHLKKLKSVAKKEFAINKTVSQFEQLMINLKASRGNNLPAKMLA